MSCQGNIRVLLLKKGPGVVIGKSSRFDSSSPGRPRGRGVKRPFVGSGFSVAGGRGAGWVGDKKEAEENRWDRHVKCPKSQ